MKRATLEDILTPEEIKLALKLKRCNEIVKQIIEPNIARINAALGQENDPRYLGYMVEFVVSQAEAEKKSGKRKI